MRPGSARPGCAAGAGRGAGLCGPWALRARAVRPPPLCSRLPQSPRPPAVRTPRRGPAPWPGPPGPAAGSAGATQPDAALGCSAFLSGKWGNACPLGRAVSRPRERAGKRRAGARGAQAGSGAGPLSVARGPPSSVPPAPCRRSLVPWAHASRAGAAPPLPSSHPEPRCPPPAFPSPAGAVQPFVYLGTSALAVSRTSSRLQVWHSWLLVVLPLTPDLPRLPSFIPSFFSNYAV